MATTLSTNLKLRLSTDLTTDALYNLQRIDSLASLYQIDATQVARIRSRSNVIIQPNDPDIGGTGTGGTVQIGSADQPVGAFNVYADSIDLNATFALADQATGGDKSLNLGYKSDLSGAVDTTANRTLLFDLEGGDRNVILGGNFSISDSLTLTLSGATTLTLPASGTVASNDNTLTLTNKTINASANTLSGIADINIDAAAAIAGTKIDPDFGTQPVQSTGGFSSTDGTPFVLPNADGTSGQALVTNGAGQLTFASIATTVLSEDHVIVGNASGFQAAVDTGSVGDIAANATTGLTIKAGVIVDADINASAAISLSKLAVLTANRALQSSALGVIEPSTVTSTELGYVSGVTSSIQTQFSNLDSAKQDQDADLDALAALATTGLITRTGAGSAVTRSIVAGSSKIAITNGDGFLGNPSVDLGTVSTDDLTEGTALFFTDERAQDAVGTILTDGSTVNFTYDDVANTITAETIDAAINHDALLNFVTNEHIDHAAVNIIAGTALSGGGDITSSRQIDLDIAGLNPVSADGADTIIILDSSDLNATKKATISSIDHDQLTNFVANEHVDHSTVSIIAGTALTGGGDLTASRTLNVDETAINHDNLSGFIADEHIAHAGVSVVAGGDDGLTVSNNNLSSNIGLAIDISGTTAETTIVGADTVLIYDASAGALRQATLTNVFAGVERQTFKANWTQLDGSSIAISHNLGTLDVAVELYDTATGATVIPDSVVRNTINQITITGSNLPGTFDFRVLIREI